jgi:hypothetical protein
MEIVFHTIRKYVLESNVTCVFDFEMFSIPHFVRKKLGYFLKVMW